MPDTAVTKCPKCAAPLRSGVIGGHCPDCVMRVVLCEDEGDADGKLASVGEYDFLEKIAYGGMGVVYRARQRSLNRVVALKMVIGGQYAGAEKIRRFRSEAESAARLDHPHIVPVYEVGENDGLPFYSMRFIEGKSLAATLAASPGGCLPAREAAELLVKVARAVHYAHQRGLLHRDLKPSNILLDELGEPHVTDFGIARDLEHGSQTLSGQVLGTPEYMPPEQATGKVHEQTTAVDVFSLGAILYRALTGQPPFAGESAASSLALAMKGHVPRPASLGVKLDTDIETICMRCLEREPAQRFGSAEALADDLSRWLEGKPIRSRRTPFPRRVWKWARRNPGIATLSVLLLTTRAVMYVKSKADNEGRLRDSLLAQAHAMVRSNEHGQRQSALDALRAAAKLAPGADVREEMITALALADYGEVAKLPWATHVEPALSPDFQTIATAEGENVLIRNRSSGEASRVPPFAGALARVGPFSADGGLLHVQTLTESRVWRVKEREWAELALGQVALNPGAETRFSPDGKLLARTVLPTEANQVGVYSLEKPEPVHIWSCPWPRATIGGFSPDSTLLAARAYGGSEVIVAEPLTGEIRHRLRLPAAAKTRTAEWSQDGRTLAVGTENFKIYLWRFTENPMPPQLMGHSGNLRALAWSADGSRIVSTAIEDKTKLWDTATGKVLAEWNWTGRTVMCSPGGDEFFAHDEAGRTSYISRLGTGDFCREIIVPHPDLDARASVGSWCVEFSPDGRLLLAGDTLGVFIYDAATGKNTRHQPADYCWALGFSDTGGFYAATRAGVMHWPLANEGAGTEILKGDSASLAAIPGLLAVTKDMRLNLFRTGHPAAFLDTSAPLDRLGAPLDRVALHPSGDWVAASSRRLPALVSEPRAYVWDLREPSAPRQTITTAGQEASLLWADNGVLLLVGDESGVRALTTGSFSEKWRLPRAGGEMADTLLALAASTPLAAACVEPGVITLFQPATGRVLTRLVHPYPRKIRHLAVSPDGSKVAAMTMGHVVQFWDLTRIRRELAAHGLDWR